MIFFFHRVIFYSIPFHPQLSFTINLSVLSLYMYCSNCNHCKRLKPEYEKVGQSFASHPAVTIASAFAYENKFNDAYGVKAYPTLLYFPAGSRQAVRYLGKSTTNRMRHKDQLCVHPDLLAGGYETLQ